MVDLFYLEAMGAWMVGFWALWGSWGPVRAWTSVGPGRAYRGALGGPGVGAVGSLGALWAPPPLAPGSPWGAGGLPLAWGAGRGWGGWACWVDSGLCCPGVVGCDGGGG